MLHACFERGVRRKGADTLTDCTWLDRDHAKDGTDALENIEAAAMQIHMQVYLPPLPPPPPNPPLAPITHLPRTGLHKPHRALSHRSLLLLHLPRHPVRPRLRLRIQTRMVRTQNPVTLPHRILERPRLQKQTPIPSSAPPPSPTLQTLPGPAQQAGVQHAREA